MIVCAIKIKESWHGKEFKWDKKKMMTSYIAIRRLGHCLISQQYESSFCCFCFVMNGYPFLRNPFAGRKRSPEKIILKRGVVLDQVTNTISSLCICVSPNTNR